MQELIKRFIDCNVPTQVCNLKCPYCYIGQIDGFSGKIKTINHTPEEVRAALSKKRMGGIIFINFCGTGETLLGDEILPIVHEILKEGHFVQIVTNGTVSKRFDEIISWDKELLSRLLIKFSYHYSEFLRLNLIDVFFDNVIKVRDAGCSFSVEITSGDGMVPYIEDMKKICLDKCGALPHVTVARNSEDPTMYKLLTESTVSDYEKTWGTFESDLFDLKMKLYGEKRKEYCYGGEWTFYLYLSNGDLKQCYKGDVIDNIFDDVTRPIHFKPIGKGCREPYCYNGHAWMTLGCIPGMNIPTYCDIRNRSTRDGNEWLTECAKEFFSHKLEENNIIYDNVSENTKILLLGDSISKGYREYVFNSMAGKADVYYPDGITTFSTYLLRYIQEFAEKLSIGSNIDVVYFNAGLWDILRINGDEPLVGIDEYKKNLQRIIDRLRYVFPNAELIFATTTPVHEEMATYSFNRMNSDVKVYNDAAVQIMKKNRVSVHDLNKYVTENLYDQYSDFTHFTENGYKAIAGQVVDCVSKAAKKNRMTEDELVDEKIKADFTVLSQKRVIVYGAGTYGERVVEELHKIGVSPYIICDQDEKKQGQSVFGIPIVSPEKYINELMQAESDLFIIAIKNSNIMIHVKNKFREIDNLDIATYRIFSSLV
jgi:lysophospholipase L1-like esterase/organic radical activating enzyme